MYDPSVEMPLIAVFSKSSLAYTCINWPTPLSSQTSLSHVCRRHVANV